MVAVDSSFESPEILPGYSQIFFSKKTGTSDQIRKRFPISAPEPQSGRKVTRTLLSTILGA